MKTFPFAYISALPLFVVLTFPVAAQAADSPSLPDVNAFLATWLKSQNQGRFKDYSALYAKKFQGIKRSGPRVRKFGHDAWLRDREKMFRKPMKVEAVDVKSTVVGTTAMLTFTQKWESKNYKDSGPKQMVLVADGGQWRISQEAMIASKLHVSEKQAQTNWFFVYHNQPVLSTEPDRQWGQGPIRVDDDFSASQNVPASRVPDGLRRLKGEKLTFFAYMGKTCTGTITGFELVAHATWHFGTREQWRSGEVPKKEIASQIWDQAAVFLAATVAYDGGSCDAALAKPSAGELPPFAAFAPADKATAKTAMDLFTRENLPAVDNDPEKLEGEEQVSSARVSEGQFKLPGLAKGGLLVNLTHQPGGVCGEETKGTVTIAHLWSVGKDGTWKRLVSDPDGADKYPILLMDVDQDGVPEILFEGGLTTRLGILRIKGDTFEVQSTLEVPFFDCGC